MTCTAEVESNAGYCSFFGLHRQNGNLISFQGRRHENGDGSSHAEAAADDFQRQQEAKKVVDVLSFVYDQREFLRGIVQLFVTLLGFLLSPLFLGFVPLLAFTQLALGAFYMAIADFLLCCLIVKAIVKKIIAYVTSEATPGGSLMAREERRQALRERLLRVCDESFLQRRVAQLARGYRVTDARVNAHLRGTSYVLERFLDTLLLQENSLPYSWEHVRSSPRVDPFKVAFHGTPPENIPSILAHGLLPTSRRSNPLCDYFSTDLSITRGYVDRPYCYRITQFQAVVFLLLKEPDVVAYEYSIITRRHAAYQLPLGVVTVEADCGPQNS